MTNTNPNEKQANKTKSIFPASICSFWENEPNEGGDNRKATIVYKKSIIFSEHKKKHLRFN